MYAVHSAYRISSGDIYDDGFSPAPLPEWGHLQVGKIRESDLIGIWTNIDETENTVFSRICTRDDRGPCNAGDFRYRRAHRRKVSIANQPAGVRHNTSLGEVFEHVERNAVKADDNNSRRSHLLTGCDYPPGTYIFVPDKDETTQFLNIVEVLYSDRLFCPDNYLCNFKVLQLLSVLLDNLKR